MNHCIHEICVAGAVVSRLAPTFEMHSNVGASLFAKFFWGYGNSRQA
jgi:hypothetical protein